MKVFVAWSVDHLDGLTAAALMSDNEVELRRISADLRRASENIKAWAMAVGGAPVLDLSTSGVVTVPVDKMTDLPGIVQRFKDMADGTVSVGVGMSLSEAFVAMRHSSHSGGDKISLYDPSMEETHEHMHAPTSNEEALQLLGKSTRPAFAQAAFRHKASGKIYATGPFHDMDQLPQDGLDLSHYDQGFVDHGGKFFEREEAARLLNHKDTLHAAHMFPEAPAHRYWTNNYKENHGEFSPASPVVKADQDNVQEPDEAVGFADDPSGFGDGGESDSSASPQASSPNPPPTTPAAPAPDQDPNGGQMAQGQDEGNEEQDPRAVIVQALQKIKSQAAVLEQMKQSNPDAFDAVKSVVAAMILMAQGMAAEAGDDEDGEGGDVSKSEDKIPGGLADNKSPQDFDREALLEGIRAELEHTSDPKIAAEIAMDHLTEDPEYYVKLKTIEKAGLPMPETTPRRFKHDWPVGTQIKGRVKIEHRDPATNQVQGSGWSQMRAGMVMSPDGHPTSSRNPNGK